MLSYQSPCYFVFSVYCQYWQDQISSLIFAFQKCVCCSHLLLLQSQSVSDQSVTTGLIIILYIFILVFSSLGTCIILIAFTLQKWLHKRTSMLRIFPTLLFSLFYSLFFGMETSLDVSTFHNEHIATVLPIEQPTVNIKQRDKTNMTSPTTFWLLFQSCPSPWIGQGTIGYIIL
jgi:hypothetical protein